MGHGCHGARRTPRTEECRRPSVMREWTVTIQPTGQALPCQTMTAPKPGGIFLEGVKCMVWIVDWCDLSGFVVWR